MPTLDKIVIRDFRNMVLQELRFSPNINCISGNNGTGKTNLLEAIHYLSMTKSAGAATDRFNFRHGCGEFAIAGTYSMEGGLQSKFAIQVSDDGRKVLKRDDKPYKRISEHMGVLPIVMVSPADGSMVSESGEERRRFLNSVLSQTDRQYLDAVQQYNRLLQQRNRMLKDSGCDMGLLEVFDLRMAALAEPIAARRREFCEALTPKVQEFYSVLSGGGEQVSLEYRTDLDEAPLDRLLADCRGRDMALRYTSAGVQRDDVLFLMDGLPIRRVGSQGQQKSFLVSLKFAQYEIMKNRHGFPPILLLDDLFDKLDMNRVSNLLKMVAGSEFGQIFLTDSNKVRISGIVDGLTRERTYYEAADGVFKVI